MIVIALVAMGASRSAMTVARSDAGMARTVAAPAAPAAAAAVEIAPRFHLISSEAGNIVLFTGDDASFAAGLQEQGLVTRTLDTVKTLGAPAIKYVLVVDEPTHGDGGWTSRGALTLAQERLRGRIKQARPTLGFSQVVQLDVKGVDINIIHERAGYSDADTIVHFEVAGLLYLGNTFTSDGYPRIDTARGGSLAGMIQTVDFFLNGFGKAPQLVEPIVGGRGPAATLSDLRDYRTMLTTVRDRVQQLAQSGKPRADVIAAKPSTEFDQKWGRGVVTPDEFTGMIYDSLNSRK
jgi:cyclase